MEDLLRRFKNEEVTFECDNETDLRYLLIILKNKKYKWLDRTCIDIEEFIGTYNYHVAQRVNNHDFRMYISTIESFIGWQSNMPSFGCVINVSVLRNTQDKRRLE